MNRGIQCPDRRRSFQGWIPPIFSGSREKKSKHECPSSRIWGQQNGRNPCLNRSHTMLKKSILIVLLLTGGVAGLASVSGNVALAKSPTLSSAAAKDKLLAKLKQAG